MRPRLLVLAPGPAGTGGIERATRTMLDEAVELWGHDRVWTVAVWGPAADGTLAGRVVDPGWARRGRGTAWARRLTFTIAVVRHARAQPEPLVIIATHANVAPVARLASIASGAPYAVWAHGREVWGSTRPVVTRALRAADSVWAGSAFTSERLSADRCIDPGRIRLLRYCVSAGSSPRGSRTAQTPLRPRVIAVSRLTVADAYKGVDTLILAWPHVLRTDPAALLVVVGEGDDRGRLERLARRLMVADHIRFAGHVTDAQLHDLYATADVFALPGRMRLGRRPVGEGFGLVFLEAAAAGLPVVAGRAAGAAEAVEDGVTGLLVDPERPIEVARAIVELLGEPVRAHTMGAAGHRRVTSQFSPSRFRTDLERLVSELLASRSPWTLAQQTDTPTPTSTDFLTTVSPGPVPTPATQPTPVEH